MPRCLSATFSLLRLLSSALMETSARLLGSAQLTAGLACFSACWLRTPASVATMNMLLLVEYLLLPLPQPLLL